MPHIATAGSDAAGTGTWRPGRLHAFLRDESSEADERWRRWCADLRRHDRRGPADLLVWWAVITGTVPDTLTYWLDGDLLALSPDRDGVRVGSQR